MAGVKGKSGGPRKNSGGARPGAGRKPKAKPAVDSANSASLEPQPQGGALKRTRAPAPDDESPIMDGTKREPLEFLELVINEPGAPLKDRIRAAIAAAQYKHTKRADGGKKEEVQGKATKAAARFKPAAPPLKLVRPANA